LRWHLKPTNDSWRVDETYVRVKGKWVYLYRAVDSSGATIDFLLSAKRDAATAQRFLTKALSGENRPEPRVINSDKHAAYSPAIAVHLRRQNYDVHLRNQFLSKCVSH
jgi:IS6 family transposase